MGNFIVLINIMNLAIVSPYPPVFTGIGQYGYHISRILAGSGQFTDITVLAGAPASSQAVWSSQPLTVNYAWQPEHLGAGRVILSHLRHINPDLVWYNLGASMFGRSPLANLLGIFSLNLVRLSGIPTVITLHELVEQVDLRALNAPGGRLARQGARILTNLATYADVVCLTMRRYVDWLSSHRPNLNCMYIPIGAYSRPEFLPEQASPELLFFTSFAPFKGLEVLIEAYRSLLCQYPDLRLTVAGAEHPRFPGYAESLRRNFESLPGLCWLGQVPEDHVRELFARAQIVVLPYIAATGSSSVLYQAAMWGRPLVVSDLPEIRSVTAESGLEVEFFKTGDAASLAGTIQLLLDAPTLRRAQASHNFSAIQYVRPEEICRLYLQAFNMALETRHSSKRLVIPAATIVESI